MKTLKNKQQIHVGINELETVSNYILNILDKEYTTNSQEFKRATILFSLLNGHLSKIEKNINHE